MTDVATNILLAEDGSTILCTDKAADEIFRLRKQVQELEASKAKLEDKLFAYGQMHYSPCFCCGYSGPGYFNPETHPCAKRHHKLYSEQDDGC